MILWQRQYDSREDKFIFQIYHGYERFAMNTRLNAVHFILKLDKQD